MNKNSAYWAKQIKILYPSHEIEKWGQGLDRHGNTQSFFKETPSNPEELIKCLNSNNELTKNADNISKNTKYAIICVLIIAFFFWFSFGFARGSKSPRFDFVLANVNIFTLPTWVFLCSFIMERKKQVHLQYLLDQFRKAYKEEHS